MRSSQIEATPCPVGDADRRLAERRRAPGRISGHGLDQPQRSRVARRRLKRQREKDRDGGHSSSNGASGTRRPRGGIPGSSSRMPTEGGSLNRRGPAPPGFITVTTVSTSVRSGRWVCPKTMISADGKCRLDRLGRGHAELVAVGDHDLEAVELERRDLRELGPEVPSVGVAVDRRHRRDGAELGRGCPAGRRRRRAGCDPPRRKTSKTSGRSRPWVSEITPRRMGVERLCGERAEGGEELGRA